MQKSNYEKQAENIQLLMAYVPVPLLFISPCCTTSTYVSGNVSAASNVAR